jgi:SnoaL-like domain
MTVEELLARESIRQTMVNYNMAGDRLRIEEFLAVFTENGILESEGVPEPDTFRYEGQAQLREWMGRWTQPTGEAPLPQGTFIRHHLSTCQIELTSATTARTRTYFTAFTNIGPDHGGIYVDAFEKVGERWLIAHRRVRMDWRLPNSRYMSAVVRTDT